MSNRDRIARMRDEAAATKREREEADKARREREPSPRRPAAAAPTGRMKVVWAVKDGTGAIAATFPYPDRKAAEADALRRSAGGRHTFLVSPHKVPFDG